MGKALLLALALGITVWARWPEESPYGQLGGEFQLMAPGPKSMSLRDFAGKNLILYLGFTRCPEVCPMGLSTLSSLMRQLKETEQGLVQVAFVSLDWKRDSPTEAHNYAVKHHKNFIGLGGEQKNIDALVKSYGAFYEFVPLEGPGGEYTVGHTDRFYVVGPGGRLRAILDGGVSFEEFRRSLVL